VFIAGRRDVRGLRRVAVALSVFLGALALPLVAQVATGNLHGAVADPSGAAVSGASIALVGAAGETRTTTTGAAGDYRFVALDPGVYDLTIRATGLAVAKRRVVIHATANAEALVRLELPGHEETVDVTANTTLVDRRRAGTATVITPEEPHRIPNPGDPWSVLRTVPGVIVAGVNVAGSAGGSQIGFAGKGAGAEDTHWTLDGVAVTDMASIGAAGAYFDLEAFQEIAVTTGGHDLRSPTGGITLSFATKRGTNRLQGSVRTYFTHDALQWSNLPRYHARSSEAGAASADQPLSELREDSRLRHPDGTQSDKANHIRQVADYGAEVGGPILKDHLWFWVSLGRQDFRVQRLDQLDDKTVLSTANAKLSWQAGARDHVSVSWFLPQKEKRGRNPGVPGVASPEDSFRWDREAHYPGGPRGMLKLEDSHAFGPDLFLGLRYAYYSGGSFKLEPRGERDADGGIDLLTGRGIGSYVFYETERPQHSMQADGGWFPTALGGRHELKFGFGYRPSASLRPRGTADRSSSRRRRVRTAATRSSPATSS
jgi:hypothetical protein